MEDILVPLGFFGAVIGTVWLFSHYTYKKRQAAHETLRMAVDKGQPLSVEMIEKMGDMVDPVRRDLRRGVILIALGAAIAIVGLIIGPKEGESLRPVLGIASFPVILGIAYLSLWRFGHDRA